MRPRKRAHRLRRKRSTLSTVLVVLGWILAAALLSTKAANSEELSQPVRHLELRPTERPNSSQEASWLWDAFHEAKFSQLGDRKNDRKIEEWYDFTDTLDVPDEHEPLIVATSVSDSQPKDKKKDGVNFDINMFILRPHDRITFESIKVRIKTEDNARDAVLRTAEAIKGSFSKQPLTAAAH